MREIKFRAWDKTRGEWYYSDSLGLEGFFARVAAEPSPYHQYVGLKDVHGVDIYEGDSVRRKRPCFKANGSKNGSVADELEVRFIQDGRGRNGFNLVSSAYCQIIG